MEKNISPLETILGKFSSRIFFRKFERETKRKKLEFKRRAQFGLKKMNKLITPAFSITGNIQIRLTKW